MKEMECENPRCYYDAFHIHMLNCEDILAVCEHCGHERVIGVQSSLGKVKSDG